MRKARHMAGPALAAAMLVLGCAGPDLRLRRGTAPDEDLLALLPAGAEAVLDIQTETLRGVPGTDRLVAAFPQALGALAEDPLADLEDLAVSITGLGTEQVQAVLLARGRPSWIRLSAALRQGGTAVTEVDYHGTWVLEQPQGRAAAMITPRTAVLGSPMAVRQVIDNARHETDGVRGQRDLLAALARAPGAKQGRPAVRGALLPPPPLRQRLREADLGEFGADADFIALALAAGDGIDLGVVAGFRQLETARAVCQRIRERLDRLRQGPLVSLFRLQPYFDPIILVAALAGPDRRSPELHLAYRLPGEELAALVARIDRIRELWATARRTGAK
ncbi:MAG: hypothetical protein RMK29_14905 [Myxococcales bacterium]|nr:hypothetical protein [Myxococcota bacterium]MDW8283003.1 hypothetical protein [Myxococcales bacterium]